MPSVHCPACSQVLVLPASSASAFRCGRCRKAFHLTPPASAIPAAAAAFFPALPGPLPPTPLPCKAEGSAARPRWARRALQIATALGVLIFLGSIAATFRTRSLAETPTPPQDTQPANPRPAEVTPGSFSGVGPAHIPGR